MLERARRSPLALHIGIDASRDGLERASTAAARRPERGGAPNALFVLAPAEDLPCELAGVAAYVSVLFPWGSLLRVVALPDEESLAGIRRLARPGATLEVVFSYDAARESAEVARLGLPPVSKSHLAAAYAGAGFELTALDSLSPADLRQIPSTWGRRLAHGTPRPAWRLLAMARC